MARFNDSTIGYGPLADRPDTGWGTSSRAAWIGSSTFSAWEGSTWAQYGFAGISSFTFPITIPQGGHGQTGAVLGFDALSPTTAKGDFIIRGNTNNERLPAGADGALIIGDSSTVYGVTWARRPESYPLFAASQATTYTWTPGIAYTAFGGSGQSNLHKRDFTYFTEARIYARGFLRNIVSGSILIKIVDVTNSVDITPDITFADPADLGVWTDHVSAWTAMGVSTTGTCQYEAQALSDDDPLQSIIIGTISLELR